MWNCGRRDSPLETECCSAGLYRSTTKGAFNWRRLAREGIGTFAMTTLRDVLNARPRDRVIAAPGVYDMVSLRMAAAMGFEALYMTGYGTVASHLGLPDAGLASYADMVGRVEAMAHMAGAPLIADGDTGYGGPLNVRHTIRGYERAGAAAIQLEDQEFPKKCGHTPDRRVISADDMVRKIAVAVEARASRDFLIIARTDARTSLGLTEAIRRGRAYAEAGADLLFVESPETEEEMAAIGRELGDKPLIANMVEGGRTPMPSNARLAELGYALAIHPVAGLLSAAAALDAVYQQIRETGSSLGSPAPLYPFAEMNRLMGFEEVWRFDKEHVEI
jgi:2,3-dimethylmalate lyase